MAIEEVNFRISDSVLSAREFFQSYIPPEGSTIEIVKIIGEGAYTLNSEVRAVWDYEGQSPEILWTIRGSSEFNNKIIIDSSKTDGIKKLALVLDNGESDRLNMSGYMTVLVKTNE